MLLRLPPPCQTRVNHTSSQVSILTLAFGRACLLVCMCLCYSARSGDSCSSVAPHKVQGTREIQIDPFPRSHFLCVSAGQGSGAAPHRLRLLVKRRTAGLSLPSQLASSISLMRYCLVLGFSLLISCFYFDSLTQLSLISDPVPILALHLCA